MFSSANLHKNPIFKPIERNHPLVYALTNAAPNRLGRIEDLHNETMAMVVAVANATARGPVICNSSSSTADLRDDFEGRLADCGCGGEEGKTATRSSSNANIISIEQ